MAHWHPRGNAYPIVWLCRNGRYSPPYAIIYQREPRPGGAERVYEARAYAAEPGELIGEYSTGDDAAVAAWEWHLERNARQSVIAGRSYGAPTTKSPRPGLP